MADVANLKAFAEAVKMVSSTVAAVTEAVTVEVAGKPNAAASVCVC